MCNTLCPIEDHKWCVVKNFMDEEWACFLRKSIDKQIRWYPKWNEREEVIWHYGTFPNVPLMGLKVASTTIPRLCLDNQGTQSLGSESDRRDQSWGPDAMVHQQITKSSSNFESKESSYPLTTIF
ncbi:hypothetical protein CR513_28777, partial [Mucuna pruriens]